MGKAADWLREERRKVLGDWFEEFEAELNEACPSCGGELLHRCKACDAPFSSTFAVDCERCGEPLRPNELFGAPIRRT